MQSMLNQFKLSLNPRVIQEHESRIFYFKSKTGLNYPKILRISAEFLKSFIEKVNYKA